MSQDAARLRVAIADPDYTGQAVLADLLLDEGVRTMVKFSDGHSLLRALMHDHFDLLVIDDALPDFSALEILNLTRAGQPSLGPIIALQSSFGRDEAGFLRSAGIRGVLLKPVAPKRFSALFRSLFKPQQAASLAA